LLIDELNNLQKLTEDSSKEASSFSMFLKQHFIGKMYRYLVFTSHLLGTLNFLSRYLDVNQGSSRHVVLQDLPLVPSLTEMTTLNCGLTSVREAVYYGLIPGMIYESGQNGGRSIAGKRELHVRAAIRNNSHQLHVCFLSILSSLIEGYLNEMFPEELGLLLDSVQKTNEEVDKVRWVPYHLQFVLRKFSEARSTFHQADLAEQLSVCCNLLRDAKELSGEGWEGLFVVILFSRCLCNKYDGVFVPKRWFEYVPGQSIEVVYNNYDATRNAMRLYGQCKTWDDLKEGVFAPANEKVCLNILYPTHNNFEAYDVFVAVFVKGERKSVSGFQLKEGSGNRQHKVHPDLHGSYIVRGKPPKHTIVDNGQGWTVPGKGAIDFFFGESGKYWTSESWNNFSNAHTSE
jgi:hypothetical protein